MIDLRVLGPLEVTRGDGDPITIASEAQRRLVGVLAVHAGTVVRAPTLQDCLGLSPGALRTSISRLRRVLGADAVATSPSGYEVCASVDATELDALIEVARSSDDALARRALEEATALWRGDPFEEFAHEPWAEATVHRLRELHAGAAEDLVVLLLDAGEVATAVAAIERLIEAHPYRDRPRALLLRALETSGRRTDALREFQSYRTLLIDEIGTEPSAALVELDRAIAGHDASGDPRPPLRDHPAWTRETRPAGSATRRSLHRLPVPVSSFIGRHEERAEVAAILRDHRLVTLTGAGGCGKTRLALSVAEDTAQRHAGGTWWVELSRVTQPREVVEQVSAALGLSPAPGGDVIAPLVRRLVGERAVLLVLDDAEPLIDPVADLVSSLLPLAPNVHLLLTSREPLGVAGEVVWRVPSMPAPEPGATLTEQQLRDLDAVQLFLERAQEARGGLVVDRAALPHLVTICGGLDGVPLALELAAARTRTLPLDEVARGIDDAVRWQSGPARSRLARHATLHASIAWSVDLVGDLERAVLTRLAVFRTPFTVEAATAVATDGDDREEVLAALGRLVDSSLLQLDDTSGRYRMLATVRQFCTLRARGTVELHRARQRHARYLATWCRQVGDGLRGIERGPFVREMPDVVSAMDWARTHAPHDALQMCIGLASVRSALGHNANVADTWTWLMSLDRDGDLAADWASAVAALMSSATAHGFDMGGLPDEVIRRLPADRRRDRGWLARGAAMVPAYHGHLGPILAHADRVVADRDDVEASIYVGFTAYMLALMGRLDEVEAHLGELRRVTRRQHTDFSVDTVGNGYAAAVLIETARGDLETATGRAGGRVPDDPAFSMTAAAALAEAGVLARDPAALQHAVDWSQRGTIPILQYLPTLIDLWVARHDGDVVAAGNAAERFWDEAGIVPVSRVHALPVVTASLLAADRVAAG